MALLVAALLVVSGPAGAREVRTRTSRLFRDVTRAARSQPSTITSNVRTSGNLVASKPLIGAKQIGGALHDLIRGAKHEVFLQFFAFETDTWLARQIRDAAAKLPKDVPVYLLVGEKSRLAGGRGAREMRRDLERFFAATPNVKVGVFKAGAFSRSILHTKAAVADNARALVLDMNIERLADPGSEGGSGWFQLGVRVDGPIAGTMRKDAVSAWKRARIDMKLPPAPRPPVARGGIAMTFLAREAGAAQDRASGNAGILALFGGARETIRVITPNLNDAHAVRALAAATAHADVHILLSKGFNDHWVSYPGQGGTNEHNAIRLARLAADPSRLHIRWYTSEKQPGAVVGNGPGASHAKWASADGRVMILGSQNLDTQSWDHSRETGVAIDDAATTRAFDEVHERIWRRSEVAFDGRTMGRPGPKRGAWLERIGAILKGR
jgi:phosphatidylserine/phosphatidylglycerophosphate/cardiolipin synthase-like enzyme